MVSVPALRGRGGARRWLPAAGVAAAVLLVALASHMVSSKVGEAGLLQTQLSSKAHHRKRPSHWKKGITTTNVWNGLPVDYKFNPDKDLETNDVEGDKADPYTSAGRYGQAQAVNDKTIYNQYGCGPNGPSDCSVGTTPSQHYARSNTHRVAHKQLLHSVHRQAMHADKGTLQALASLMRESDFPHAIGGRGGARQQLAALPSPLPDLPEAPKEFKATDAPIGTAEAANILADANLLGKSKGPEGTISEWKSAVKGSGPKILEDVTDDATAFNPFPKQALSEKMEIQDVWNKAQALAKPAGKLDGTADENKKSIDNAGAQADAAAYMAANEAAAVDSYDVSMPNPDSMAASKRAASLGRARAVGGGGVR